MRGARAFLSLKAGVTRGTVPAPYWRGGVVSGRRDSGGMRPENIVTYENSRAAALETMERLYSELKVSGREKELERLGSRTDRTRFCYTTTHVYVSHESIRGDLK